MLDMPVALPTSMDARKGLVCWLGCRPVCMGCRPPPVWKLATESWGIAERPPGEKPCCCP